MLNTVFALIHISVLVIIYFRVSISIFSSSCLIDYIPCIKHLLLGTAAISKELCLSNLRQSCFSIFAIFIFQSLLRSQAHYFNLKSILFTQSIRVIFFFLLNFVTLSKGMRIHSLIRFSNNYYIYQSCFWFLPHGETFYQMKITRSDPYICNLPI